MERDKTKKEVIYDLFFKPAPPLNDSCNHRRVTAVLKEINNQFLKSHIG